MSAAVNQFNIPDPHTQYGLYHYRVECPECGWWAQSDKGMYAIELDYMEHYLKKHFE